VQPLTMYCGNCGTGLPAEARFCFLCGAPAAAPVAAAGEALPARTCRIRLWRGYVRSDFFVELGDPDGGAAVLRSPSFAWRRDEPPPADRDDVRDAYDALVGRLRDQGWEQVGRLSPWYAQRFRRRDDPSLQAVGEDEGGSRVRDLRKEAP
jgi:hypothetical protein